MDYKRGMATARVALGAATLGAVTMYYADPHGGRYRRALVRDQITHFGHRLTEAARAVAFDRWNRARGLAIEGMARATDRLSCAPVADDVLAARVRAEVGHCVEHPRSIEVTAEEGQVTLSGFVEVEELGRLMHRVQAIPGVALVHNRLLAYAPQEAEEAPAVGSHADEAPVTTHARVPGDARHSIAA